MDKLYIPLLLADYVARISLATASIRFQFGQKLGMTSREGAATRHLIQMRHFITTGLIKQAESLSLFQKKQESIFGE